MIRRGVDKRYASRIILDIGDLLVARTDILKIVCPTVADNYYQAHCTVELSSTDADFHDKWIIGENCTKMFSY